MKMKSFPCCWQNIRGMAKLRTVIGVNTNSRYNEQLIEETVIESNLAAVKSELTINLNNCKYNRGWAYVCSSEYA